MGSVENASDLLHYWIGQHTQAFDPDASSSFEATVAHSIKAVVVEPGFCKCTLLVTSRLQNNYGTMNGGGMAALTCITAGAALETLGPRSGIVTSNSMDCLSAVPLGTSIEITGKVSTGDTVALKSRAVKAHGCSCLRCTMWACHVEPVTSSVACQAQQQHYMHGTSVSNFAGCAFESHIHTHIHTWQRPHAAVRLHLADMHHADVQ